MARVLAMLGCIAAVAAGAAPAMAAPTARVVRCAASSCVEFSGDRPSKSTAVALNQHAVDVAGGRKWRVRVPVATVRDWSVPRARSVAVSVDDATYQVPLPVGLLGQPQDLAMLVVRAK